MSKYTVSKHKFIMLLPLIPIAFLGKIYEYRFLGSNAFKLINYVLDGIFKGTVYGLSSVDFPVKILSIFKAFHLDTPVSSGIFCAIIMNIVCFGFFLKSKEKYTLKEYIFIYCTMFILNFTVFDFNKDIIQFWIVFVLYLLIVKKGTRDFKKILFCEIIILIESMLFRRYYILLAGLFPMIYYLLKDVAAKAKKKRIILKMILILFVFFLAVYAMKYISFSSYMELLTRRNNLENIEAATMIRNVIPGDSFLSFCLNYSINFVRCLFPIELLLRGPKYFIFAFYMLFITYNIVLAIKHINRDSILPVSFVFSYCMLLAASESDFGTFVRHQAVLVFCYLLILILNRRGKNA